MPTRPPTRSRRLETLTLLSASRCRWPRIRSQLASAIDAIVQVARGERGRREIVAIASSARRVPRAPLGAAGPRREVWSRGGADAPGAARPRRSQEGARVRTITVALIGVIVVCCGSCRRAASRCDRLSATPATRRACRPIAARLEHALDTAMLDLPPRRGAGVAGGMLAAAILGFALGGGAAALAGVLGVGVGVPPVSLLGLHGRRGAASSRPRCRRRSIDVASELRARAATIATAITGIAGGEWRARGRLRTHRLARLASAQPLTDALAAWPGTARARRRHRRGRAGDVRERRGRAADALEGLASSLRDRGAWRPKLGRSRRRPGCRRSWSRRAVAVSRVVSSLTDADAFHALTGTPVAVSV